MYKQGEVRDDSGNIVTPGSWGTKTPYKDIVNIIAENLRVLLQDGAVNAGALGGKTLLDIQTDAQNEAQSYADTKLALNGGTLTGPLILSGDPTAALQAVTKQYADSMSISANRITGVLDITNIPQSAIEKLTQVANQAARFALTTDSVQVGDSVKQLDTGVMYVVVDVANLNNENGYVSYAAGTAASVPWSGVTGKPNDAAGYGITDVYTKNAVDSILGGYYTKTQSDSKYAPSGYGLGVDAIQVTDCHSSSLFKGGMYWCDSSALNIPPSPEYFWLTSFGLGYTDGTVKAVGWVSGNIYEAKCRNGSWSSWKQIATTDNPVFNGSVSTTSGYKLMPNNADYTGRRNWQIINEYSSLGTLDIMSSSSNTGAPDTPRITINGINGNVGIGKMPTRTLDVSGGLSSSSASLNKLAGFTTPDNYGLELGFCGDTSEGNKYAYIQPVGSATINNLVLGYTSLFNVGIGVIPKATLHSAGSTIIGIHDDAYWASIGNEQMQIGINGTNLVFYIKDASGVRRALYFALPSGDGSYRNI